MSGVVVVMVVDWGVGSSRVSWCRWVVVMLVVSVRCMVWVSLVAVTSFWLSGSRSSWVAKRRYW